MKTLLRALFAYNLAGWATMAAIALVTLVVAWRG